MKWKKVICIATVAATSLVVFSYSYGESGLKIHFLNVGQGDAIYIRTPSGKDMLIDGGPSAKILERLSNVMPLYDRKIDVVMASHPDADHIGGLPSVLERFSVGAYIHPGIDSKNNIDDEIENILKQKNIVDVIARSGMDMDFGDGVSFLVLYPDNLVGVSDTNEASIVGMLAYGSTTIMFTGDAPKKIENRLIAKYGSSLESDVLKVGHHGSHTSTAEEFVRIVTPKFAVISAGRDNRYGHPHKEVMGTLERLDVIPLITSRDDDITFSSDGKEIKQKGGRSRPVK